MAEQYDNTNSFAMFKNEKGDNEARTRKEITRQGLTIQAQ